MIQWKRRKKMQSERLTGKKEAKESKMGFPDKVTSLKQLKQQDAPSSGSSEA